MSGRLAPLVIVGPTASGKSDLALALARRAPEPIEIISADAMAVYRGMDIGTAKAPVADRAEIRHHLVDVADPGEEYTMARFQAEVAEVLADIEGRGGAAIVVGGTGLYVRAVVDDFTVPGQFPEVRATLAAEPSVERLHRRLTELDPVAAAKMLPTNRRRIERALEVTIGSGRPFSSFGPGVDRYPPTRFVQAGLRLDRAELDRRIDTRYDRQMVDGFLAEVDALAAGGPLSRTAAQALGYRELLAHRAGEMAFEEALELARKRTRRFARRQERWFRRDPRIVWFDALGPDLVIEVERFWRNSLVGKRGELST
ncbi:MAG: tRNA (adenosine(37)-N6)-dimethylallyltransferase MiaA [Actinomycetota bacterium]